MIKALMLQRFMRIPSERALAEELAGIKGVYAVLGVVRLAGCFTYFRRKLIPRNNKCNPVPSNVIRRRSV